MKGGKKKQVILDLELAQVAKAKIFFLWAMKEKVANILLGFQVGKGYYSDFKLSAKDSQGLLLQNTKTFRWAKSDFSPFSCEN